MKLELNEVVFNNADWTAEEHGSLRKNLEKGDQIKFAKLKADKQVTIMVTEKGQDKPNKQIVASKNVSAMIKSAITKGSNSKSVLKALLELNVIKNDKGYFLTLPAGEIGESFTLDQVEKAESIDFVPADLVAF